MVFQSLNGVDSMASKNRLKFQFSDGFMHIVDGSYAMWSENWVAFRYTSTFEYQALKSDI